MRFKHRNQNKEEDNVIISTLERAGALKKKMELPVKTKTIRSD